MADGLLVGDDFADVVHFYARQGEQRMLHMQADASDDVEAMLLHEIIDRIDRAVGAVFDGQDAVVAKPFLDGLCDAFEVAEPRDVRKKI